MAKKFKPKKPKNQKPPKPTPLDLGALDQLFDEYGVNEIELRIAIDSPRSYQAIGRFRDRNRIWAVGVGHTGSEALSKMLKDAKKRHKVDDPLYGEYPKGVFYQRKPAAEEEARILEKDYEGRIEVAKVEFEPYKGWIIVAFVIPTREDVIHDPDLALRAQVRVHPYLHSEDDKKRSGKGVKSSGKGKPSKTAKTSSPAPSGDRAGWTKSQLVEEYKSHHGKQPNNSIKKDDLRILLENEEKERNG